MLSELLKVKCEMNGKKLVLVLGLLALVIAIPASYVLAHPGGYYSDAFVEQDQDEDWWQEMNQYMDEHWREEVDDEWFDEMREHMEDRWTGTDDEDWFQEMEQYMEERWEEQGNFGSYGYGGFGVCYRWGR